MTFLLDSDVVADWLAGKPATVERVANLEPEGLSISQLTYGEIYEGIYFGRDPRKSERVFRDFLRSVDIVPLNPRTLRRFARIRGELCRSGLMIGDPDILIAATAIERGLTLMTGNAKHFSRIDGLVVL